MIVPSYINRLGVWAINLLILVSVGTFLFVVTSENLFQEFMPRATCMFQNQKLIATHLISDLGIFLSYLTISGCLYWLYNAFRTRDIPFKGFFWMFAGFIFLCGLTHLMGVINIFVTYYWLDGMFKLLTCWFSIAVAISLLRAVKSIRDFKTPAEYKALMEEIEELKEQLKRKD